MSTRLQRLLARRNLLRASTSSYHGYGHSGYGSDPSGYGSRHSGNSSGNLQQRLLARRKLMRASASSYHNNFGHSGYSSDHHSGYGSGHSSGYGSGHSSGGYGHSSGGYSHGGYFDDCCPPVVDNLTFIALMSFLALGTYFLRIRITMDLGRRKKRRRSISRKSEISELEDILFAGMIHFFILKSGEKKLMFKVSFNIPLLVLISRENTSEIFRPLWLPTM